MDTTKITLDVSHPGQDLHLAIRLDGQDAWQENGAYAGPVVIDMNDDEGTHVLEIIMHGKQPHHTQIDAKGEIEQDAVIEIKHLAFDDINLGHLVVEKAVYFHDHNGTTAPAENKFYGTLGCNGTVRMEFTTPIYLWLLENM